MARDSVTEGETVKAKMDTTTKLPQSLGSLYFALVTAPSIEGAFLKDPPHKNYKITKTTKYVLGGFMF